MVELKNKIAQKDAEIAEKDATIEAQKKQIEELTKDIETLQKEVDEGLLSKEELLKKLDEIMTKVSTLKNTDTKSLESKISSLESSVKNIRSGEKTDLSGVQSELSTIKSQLTTLATKPVTTTTPGGGGYYGGGAATKADSSTTTDKTKITEKEHKHDWKYTDNKDGKTHTKKCIECGETVKDEEHEFDEVTGKCTCGAKKDPLASIEVKKTEVVDQNTCEHKWKYTINTDNTHTKVCEICKKEITEPHNYNFNKDEHMCECGTKDPVYDANSTNTTLIDWKRVSDTGETLPEEAEEEVVEEEEEKGNSVLPWLIGLAIIMLGIVGFVIWKFVIQNKNKDDEDDFEDEDFMSDDNPDEEAGAADEDLSDISLDDEDFSDGPVIDE